MSIEGLLLVNKQQGWTSHDCVALIRKYLGIKKVGHSGTLDPMAEGLLLIAVGKATRMIEYTDDFIKKYVGTIRLGERTDTDDIWGNVVEKKEINKEIIENIESVIPRFIGDIEQQPPAYSAIRVDGKRLYEYARKKQKVEIKSRKVHIENIKIIEKLPESLEATLEVDCKSGTYIRSLFREIGEAMGVPATMSMLVRIGIGDFSLISDDVVRVEDIKKAREEGADRRWLMNKICPADSMIRHILPVKLKENSAIKFFMGNPVKCKEGKGLRRVYWEDKFLGIGRKEGKLLKPVKVMLSEPGGDDDA